MPDEPISAEVLREYLNSLRPVDQDSYAKRCGTTVGYLRKAISAKQRIAESTAILLERESGGAVSVESIRPDVDWGYLRGTSKRSRLNTSRRCG